MSLLIGGMVQELADQENEQPRRESPQLQTGTFHNSQHRSVEPPRANGHKQEPVSPSFPRRAARRQPTAPSRGGCVAALAGRPVPRNTSTAASWAGTDRFRVGGGLDGRWCRREAAADAIRRDGIVFVRVGEPSPRQVPVLARWEGVVCDLAASAGNEFLVRGSPGVESPPAVRETAG